MMITCSNCDYKIETNSMIVFKYMCPNCFKVFRVNITRIILFTFLLTIPLIGLEASNQSDIFKLSWSGLWVWLSLSVIKPKVCKYTIEKHKGALDETLYSLGSIKKVKNISA